MNVHEDIVVSNNGVEAGGAGGQVPEELVGPGGAAAELATVAELATAEAAGGTAVGAGGLGDGGVGGTAELARMTLEEVLREPTRARLRREVEDLGLNPDDYPANVALKKIIVTLLFPAGPQPGPAPVHAERAAGASYSWG